MPENILYLIHAITNNWLFMTQGHYFKIFINLESYFYTQICCVWTLNLYSQKPQEKEIGLKD